MLFSLTVWAAHNKCDDPQTLPLPPRHLTGFSDIQNMFENGARGFLDRPQCQTHATNIFCNLVNNCLWQNLELPQVVPESPIDHQKVSSDIKQITDKYQQLDTFPYESAKTVVWFLPLPLAALSTRQMLLKSENAHNVSIIGL